MTGKRRKWLILAIAILLIASLAANAFLFVRIFGQPATTVAQIAKSTFVRFFPMCTEGGERKKIVGGLTTFANGWIHSQGIPAVVDRTDAVWVLPVVGISNWMHDVSRKAAVAAYIRRHGKAPSVTDINSGGGTCNFIRRWILVRKMTKN